MVETQRTPDRAVETGRGALFIGAAKVFFMVTAFLQKVLLTKVVGSADFGSFSVVAALVSVVNNATVQGTIQSVSKFTAEDDSRADAVKRAGLLLQLAVGSVLGLGFFFAAPWIADAYHHPEFTRWFRVVALIPFFYSLYSVFVGSANGQRRFRVQAGFDMTFSSLKTVLLLGGAALFGVTGACVGFAAAAFLILLVAAAVMRLPVRSGTAADEFPIKRLLGYMVGIVVYTLLINLALNYDILLLRRFAAVAASTADEASRVTGHYEAVRNFSLLPYQALLVITFVIFPLVSRSTFEADRAATRVYVTQTLRYALILATFMASVLCARPLGLLVTFYRPEYGAGATALPILVAGIVCLSLLGISGTIINAAGAPKVAIVLVAITVIVGGGVAFAIVPGRSPAAMLNAEAAASAIGMAAGLVAALIHLRRRFEASPPLATLLRVLVASGAAIALGRLVPGQGKILTLATLVVAGLVFLVVLVVLREFGPEDRAKFRRVLGRR